MTPDPLAALARFTPASAVDPAELLFAAGRASARTHWGWKAAVGALALSNVALLAVLVFGSRDAAPVVPSPLPIVPIEPAPVSPSAPAPPADPWSYRALRAMDADLAPVPEPAPNLLPQHEPLTVMSGRRGGLE
ncbi:hypothetical protein [Frigoriglobus tundricola]|uniref:Uncharacterized protein n=1 Tax=Frigoriglobus tundricola TaxID=2774151 RepID=A0A6M5YXV2_9BACT|nr:hypothetical protein [Frigoriglobus tundricola]QJW98334.1 hypothetical protein FTUN_5922 [Frigoriglobus tundricola]